MLSGLLKFILGFFLAIAILIGSGVAAALYFMNRTAIPPTKPIFANDHPALRTQSPKATVVEATNTSQPEPSSSPTPSANPTESPKAQESPKPLPPGAYLGTVTWSQGLSLRAEPKQDAQRVGGAAFNQKVVILEESQDKAWQKIRLENGEQEGWVKIGNTKKIENTEEAQQ
ncbi:MAG: SH3 domain-containing protein [Mojavia pulchra JT2-VF2]|jgi:hypothetical protein|uniref:SH3 domain-containing protein n=1 Tax=Mojavia pulchra JT2-VF2 TaxID=287848 RepID=A0A951UE33_9NOST|nr:SH3 domain-containing protein [Mojavia pulchra JT2-VF2]